jgi:hypothetical protein
MAASAQSTAAKPESEARISADCRMVEPDEGSFANSRETNEPSRETVDPKLP